MAAWRYKISLFMSKKYLLASCAHSWNIFQQWKKDFISRRCHVIYRYALLSQSNTKKKNSNFWPKSWVNSLGKIQFFDYVRWIFLSSRKACFLSGTSSNIFMSFLSQKGNTKKFQIFWPKSSKKKTHSYSLCCHAILLPWLHAKSS